MFDRPLNLTFCQDKKEKELCFSGGKDEKKGNGTSVDRSNLFEYFISKKVKNLSLSCIGKKLVDIFFKIHPINFCANKNVFMYSLLIIPNIFELVKKDDSFYRHVSKKKKKKYAGHSFGQFKLHKSFIDLANYLSVFLFNAFSAKMEICTIDFFRRFNFTPK